VIRLRDKEALEIVLSKVKEDKGCINLPVGPSLYVISPVYSLFKVKVLRSVSTEKLDIVKLICGTGEGIILSLCYK